MKVVGYPRDPDQEQIIAVDDLLTLLKSLLVKCRMFPPDAEIAATRMVEADVRGLVSHGSRALERYLPDMEMGDIDPRAQILTEVETPAVAVLNGSQGMGHVAATKAMKLAIEKAATVGCGTVVVKNSHHYGAGGVYALLAAEEQMIGQTQTSAGKPNVLAPCSSAGGETNHGLAWACPYDHGMPIVLDMAIAESSWGKIHVFAEYGIPIPEHWAVDASGHSTTDAEAAALLNPIGGPKGFGMALFSSILTGGLGGRKLAIEKTRSVASEGGEHYFHVLDIKQFVELEKFQARLQSAIEKIHALPTAEGCERVTLPGEREGEQAEEARKHGLPLHRKHVSVLEKLGQDHKVEIPWK